MNSKIFSFLLALISPFAVFSQAMDPIKWEAKYKDLGGNTGEITITATIEHKWHLYSQNVAPDAGPIPTLFTWSGAKNFQPEGKTEEEGAREDYDKQFGAKIASFENKAIFKQKIKRTNAKAFNTVIKVEYMTCNDMQCLPPKTVDLNLSVPEAKK